MIRNLKISIDREHLNLDGNVQLSVRCPVYSYSLQYTVQFTLYGAVYSHCTVYGVVCGVHYISQT